MLLFHNLLLEVLCCSTAVVLPYFCSLLSAQAARVWTRRIAHVRALPLTWRLRARGAMLTDAAAAFLWLSNTTISQASCRAVMHGTYTVLFIYRSV